MAGHKAYMHELLFRSLDTEDQSGLGASMDAGDQVCGADRDGNEITAYHTISVQLFHAHITARLQHRKLHGE